MELAVETAFRTRYRETYGYDLPSHIVQLVNLRLTVTAASADLVWPETKLNATGESVGTRMQVLEDGTNREISVVRRHDLTAGEELTGPAIVEDFGATIRILSGHFLAVCDRHPHSQRARRQPMTDSMLMQKDPVTFEVVRGGLYAICEEMKSVMMRASFSPLLSLSADLSCAILDQKGDVVAQGSDIPVHLGAMPFSAKGIIEAFPWRP